MLERNPFFTGRESFLAKIAASFADNQRQVALCGPGGIGKTQIALEYVYRHQHEYKLVIWLDASSRGVLSVEAGAFADQHLRLVDAERYSEPQLFAAVKDWLQDQERWLLVLDQIEDLALIKLVVPQGRGHVLLTTRRPVEAVGHRAILSIGPMDTGERALLVLRRAKLHPPSFSDNHVEKAIKQLSSDALALLRLLSFLHSDVAESLLIGGAATLRKPLRGLTHLDLERMIIDLLALSLVNRDEGILHISRSVQDIVKGSLTVKQQGTFVRQAVRLINDAFPVVRFDTRTECECLLPQAEHCAILISSFHLTVKEGGLLLERLGDYCFRRASYDQAETYLTQARDLYEHSLRKEVLDSAQTLNTLGLLYSELARYHEAEVCHRKAQELRERELGPDHSTTAESLHNLAVIAAELGNYQEAEHLYIRVLQIAATHDDPDVATTFNNLGVTYYDMGRYAEAEEFYQRALSIYEQEKGPNHPDVAIPLNGLGALAEEQSDYQRAETLYQRALTIREQGLEPKHPDIAYSLNHLADVYESMGKYQQAEEFYQRALAIIEHVFEPDHPDVALLHNNLAFLANKQGHYQQAELLYQQALNIYEQALGTEHPYTASVIHNLGRLYHNIGDNEQAESFLRHARILREQLLGPDHVDVAGSLSALGSFLADRQRDAEAEPLLQRALELRLQILGVEHSDTIRVREKYQELLARMKKEER